jgi:hypothetical protein
MTESVDPSTTPAPATERPLFERLGERMKLFVAPDQVVELRALAVQRGPGRPHVEGGFFDHAHLVGFAKEALALTKIAKGVYFTLNPINPALLARCCNRTAWANSGDLAKDRDVIVRQFLLVDVDPKRPAGVSATDAEKLEAKDVTFAVREFLRGRGWPEPILSDSGNGFHLLYRVDLPTDDGGEVARLLAALAARFDTPRVTIDRSVFNPARICKVPGTFARKGDSTADRPHRRACVLEIPPT